MTFEKNNSEETTLAQPNGGNEGTREGQPAEDRTEHARGRGCSRDDRGNTINKGGWGERNSSTQPAFFGRGGV